MTALGHGALGKRLAAYFMESGLMRKDQARSVVRLFRGLGIVVRVLDAKEKASHSFRWLRDPEQKRVASL